MKENMSSKTTFLQKIIYGLGDVGVNLVWMLPSSFLTMYYTDSVYISAAYIGTTMLICRMFDGVSDLIMGVIIDKTKSRFGKARPWLLYMGLPLVLSIFFTFYVPSGFSTIGKNIYIFITYFIMSVICYTAVNLSYHAMLPRFSLTSQDRVSVSAVRSVFALIATMVVSILTPSLITKFGGYNSQKAWSTIVIVYGVIAEIALLVTFFGIKEKIKDDISEKDEAKPKTNTWESIKVLLSSRYFYISIFVFLTFYINNGASGVNIYYARDVFGNENLYGIMNMVSLIPILLFTPFMPKLLSKAGKRNAMCGGMIIAAVLSLGLFLFARNPMIYLILCFFRSIASCPVMSAMYTLAGDIVDYNQWKHGFRTEGIATSINSIGMKLGTGLGSAILGWSLAIGHYDGTLTTQAPEALNSMIFVATIIPMVVYAIAAILLAFWNLEKYQDEISTFVAGQTRE